jgi:thioester reductase-like protein
MSVKAGVLLTGATGFLGRYLLRDLLLAGHEVTVLARDRDRTPAAQRIGALIAFWEQALGRSLPRPAVVSGALDPRGPALDAAGRRWLARHCRTVVHAAASTAFHRTADGQPHRTNVAGTRALVELCGELGLVQWHHVSTAFVCGRRPGPVAEGDPGGPPFHNPYEESKWAAEQMLRRCGGLSLTVYRPSLVVGDSRTGYTSLYTGFYRFLELAWRLAAAAAPRRPGLARRPFPLRLPLDGTERYDLVCVDWVSRAVIELLGRPAWHGRTFQLTARHPVRSGLVREVGVEELGLDGVRFVGAGGPADPTHLEAAFLDGIGQYWPYLEGTPEFTSANTAAALPHLDPPEVDRPMLQRLIRFALADNWGRGLGVPRAC